MALKCLSFSLPLHLGFGLGQRRRREQWKPLPHPRMPPRWAASGSHCEGQTKVRTSALRRKVLTLAWCCFIRIGAVRLPSVVNFRVCSHHLAEQAWEPDPGGRTSRDDPVRGANCQDVAQVCVHLLGSVFSAPHPRTELPRGHGRFAPAFEADEMGGQAPGWGEERFPL